MNMALVYYIKVCCDSHCLPKVQSGTVSAVYYTVGIRLIVKCSTLATKVSEHTYGKVF